MIVFLRNMIPSIAFCSEEIADVGLSRSRQAIFELAGKDPVLVTGDFNAEIDERGPQHFVANGLKLAVNEWVDSILSFQLEGFKFGGLQDLFPGVWSLQDLFET